MFVNNDGGRANSGAGANDYVENYGTMGGASGGVTGGGVTASGAGARIVNAGTIYGAVTLEGAGDVFDSSRGLLFQASGGTTPGEVVVGPGGGTVIGALNGGQLLGGAGNDVLIANQAATAGAATSLDGGAGTNALYGGGGDNFFLSSGDAAFNQIWGGLSTSGDYANNTLNFTGAAAGVYVDLLAGHDAWIGGTAGQGFTGAGRLEDSIANVPNVVASDFGDVIQAGSGAGRVTGGGGADQLYSATGSATTFAYTAYGDSNLVTGYDTIASFKTASDRIDLTAFHSDASHLVVATQGLSSSVYLEQTPGSFNPATDLALSVVSTTPGGLQGSNFIF